MGKAQSDDIFTQDKMNEILLSNKYWPQIFFKSQEPELLPFGILSFESVRFPSRFHYGKNVQPVGNQTADYFYDIYVV